MNRAERRKHSSDGRAAAPALRAFAQAGAARHAGDLADAERHYRRCLALDPAHRAARHDLGVLLMAMGRPIEAAAELRAATLASPTDAQALANLALALADAGEVEAATAQARRAAALQPGHSATQAALGHALSLGLDLTAAATAFRQALSIDPAAPAGLRLRFAALLRRLGRSEDALAEAVTVLAREPGHAVASIERAVALTMLGRPADARAALRAAFALASDDASLRLLCRHMLESNDAPAALGLLDDAVERLPGLAAPRVVRAEVKRACRDMPGALGDLQAATALAPDDADIAFALGDLLYAGARYEAATAAFLQALTLRPDWIEATSNLAIVRLTVGDIPSGLALLQHARALAPDRLQLSIDLLWARLGVCDWAGLWDDFRGCTAACVTAGVAFPPFTLLGFGIPPEEFQLWARAWAEAKAPPQPALTSAFPRLPRPANRRLRVGYLSADFKAHATATLVGALWRAHDRTRVETIGYNIGSLDGSGLGTAMAGALDDFVDLTLLDDAAAAARIAADGLDVLVDLKGYTTESRPGILAFRPAPVQVNYLGFPGSMGTGLIDYIVADRLVAPPEHRTQFDEAVVHLPHSYQPNDPGRPGADLSARRADHGLPDDGFVFCCFNNTYKITPGLFGIWMRVLGAVPGSVLWLLGSNDLATDNLRREATARGVDERRLVFAPRTSLPVHIGRMGLADLFLDTLPVNAHTTASEALWAGLPVLTATGPHFVGRVAASLLHAVGLPELATDDLGAYERLAVALAHDPGRLGALRDRLIQARATAPLFDIARYARHFEAALARMAERRDAGLPPADFAIEDGAVPLAAAPMAGPASLDALLGQLDALIDPRTAG